jgi:hypothetical protein
MSAVNGADSIAPEHQASVQIKVNSSDKTSMVVQHTQTSERKRKELSSLVVIFRSSNGVIVVGEQ